ncbi:hypothetical protein CBR_g12763 [Chara braunii]|uniref:WLM domain-containing protein n=1 Tax=Chara braunii TaxID=69332 RepID=A0A388KSJ2_CHABU|nr:hypothetical protein CBR_g12763 [Chara braunii]|eukprot:GBG73045.1 hypothetical protein CBR_g12763 [Chara braunii]
MNRCSRKEGGGGRGGGGGGGGGGERGQRKEEVELEEEGGEETTVFTPTRTLVGEGRSRVRMWDQDYEWVEIWCGWDGMRRQRKRNQRHRDGVKHAGKFAGVKEVVEEEDVQEGPKMARQVSFTDGSYDKVWDIKTLGKANDVEARRLLEAVAKQVQPIMRRRRWRVNLLSEFSPPQRNLLGLNIDGGQEIRIRLRQPGNDLVFFAYEHVLGTMLHELVHIEVGPHNAQFYKLLDELNRECDELIAKGVSGSGAGFDCRGQRLGGITHNPPPSHPKRNVLAVAAEKRARVNQLLPSGPRRLGGDTSLMRHVPAAAAAAMAAERRLRDDVWCGSSEVAPRGSSQGGPRGSSEDAPSTSSPTSQGGPRGTSECAPRGYDVDSRRALPAERTPVANGSESDDLGHPSIPGKGTMISPNEGPSVGVEGASSRRDLWTRGSSRDNDRGIPQGGGLQTRSTNADLMSSDRRVLRDRRDCQGGASNTLDEPIRIDEEDHGGPTMEDDRYGGGGRGERGNDRRVEESERRRGVADSGGRRELGEDSHAQELAKKKDGTWECKVCTLVNRPLALQCDACGVQRPVVASSASSKGVRDLLWTCKFCTLENSSKAERCGACDTWRYSTGAPVAIRGPAGT